MRIAQASAEKLPGVYVVTAMDLGSLHPRDGSIHSDKKVELGHRVALVAAVAVYNQTRVVWSGPRVSQATVDRNNIAVSFEVQPGAGGLALNASAACPPVILPVFCTGAGFETLDVQGNWSRATGAKQDFSNPLIVLVTPTTPVTTVQRIRYAYADWPVASVRNSAGDQLPARIFDIPVSH